ncbi:MAG TPA: type II secretion system F family protein [Mycobacteriales bacterium]|nr:type II secretion system F family protein [Mycobacteriales bacterium]
MTSAQRRLKAVAPARGHPPEGRRRAGLRPAFAVATAVVCFVGFHGVVGLAVGLACAIGVVTVAKPDPRPRRASPDVVPAVVELIAGCLAAGLPMPAALDAASVAGDDVTREACLAAAAALRRGAPASEAWQAWAVDPALEPVARMTRRTTHSGASVADDLRRVAARLRAQRHSRIQQRVQQASIWIVIPLGLCFMPAFVLVAVVPVIVGLVTHLR